MPEAQCQKPVSGLLFLIDLYGGQNIMGFGFAGKGRETLGSRLLALAEDFYSRPEAFFRAKVQSPRSKAEFVGFG